MFHWSIFTTEDANRFVLTVPMHWFAILLVGLPAVLLVVGLQTRKMSMSTWNLKLWLPLIVLLALGLLTENAELTLDRTAGTATLREFLFYHWSATTYPLEDVEGVSVATGSQADQLRLKLGQGRFRSISFMDQYGGKDEVAYKANAWLHANMR